MSPWGCHKGISCDYCFLVRQACDWFVSTGLICNPEKIQSFISMMNLLIYNFKLRSYRELILTQPSTRRDPYWSSLQETFQTSFQIWKLESFVSIMLSAFFLFWLFPSVLVYGLVVWGHSKLVGQVLFTRKKE